MKYLVSLVAQSSLDQSSGSLPPIPWNTGAAYTGWIYRILRQDCALGDVVHRAHPLKNFAVSPLQFEAGHADSRGYTPHTPFAALTFGTFDPAIAAAFEQGAMHTPLLIGSVSWQVTAVVPYPEPVWSTTHPLILSSASCYPIALRHPRDVKPHPAWARDSDWLNLLSQNLVHKAERFRDIPIDAQSIRCVVSGGWRARFQQPYGHPIAAFQPRESLVISAPPVVYDVIFTLGLGLLNTAGLGVLTLDASASLAGWTDDGVVDLR